MKINELIVKKSRFIAYRFEVTSKEEFTKQLEAIKKEHDGARHVVYAYLINNGAESAGMSDDGEPQGTAGKPLLSLIRIKELENVALVVVRYFGGKKLGAGPLLRAYVGSAKKLV